MKLARDVFDGPDGAPPCVIAHGLYGSGRNWRVIATKLAASRKVVTVDMRNHGDSPKSQAHGYPDLAEDLSQVIADLGGKADVIGHSMGGKAAMTLALSNPDTVSRLVVGDIAPVAYSHDQLKFVEAMRAVDLGAVTRRSDAAAQLGKQGVEPALQSFFTQSLDLTEKSWRYNLDALEAEMPKIMGFPEFSGATFDGPTLFLTGETSDYVRPEHRPAIRGLFPNARFAKLRGAGHWLHADKPREFVSAIEVFLA